MPAMSSSTRVRRGRAVGLLRSASSSRLLSSSALYVGSPGPRRRDRVASGTNRTASAASAPTSGLPVSDGGARATGRPATSDAALAADDVAAAARAGPSRPRLTAGPGPPLLPGSPSSASPRPGPRRRLPYAALWPHGARPRHVRSRAPCSAASSPSPRTWTAGAPRVRGARPAARRRRPDDRRLVHATPARSPGPPPCRPSPPRRSCSSTRPTRAASRCPGCCVPGAARLPLLRLRAADGVARHRGARRDRRGRRVPRAHLAGARRAAARSRSSPCCRRSS